MKALTLMVCMLFCGSLYASETPAFLTPPQKDEHVIRKVAFVGFIATAAASVVVGLMAGSKVTSAPNTANHMYVASGICDGAAAVLLATSVLTF